ncbi:MAG: pyridoxamine 5'-phosphate oxidase family protein [Nitrosomonadales bacterium]|nr:pyridoxamine 5'-phosphate oxidase family protein [Nitrosomonadales bacterium]
MNNAHEARSMLRAHRYGALSTLSKKFDGHPFGSITPYLVDHDGSLLILISALAEHTKNIAHDPRVSLITHDQRDPHIQTQGRVTVIGNAELEPNRERASLRYLRYFPEAQVYLAMQDFSFYRIRPIAIRYIGGFGKIHWINMEHYLVAQADAFAKHEEELLAGANMKHQAALRNRLQQQHNIDETNVRAIGFDCDGVDVRCDEQLWRLDFSGALSRPSLDALSE